MPITQIPFQDPPVAPPEKPQPEQLGLYDARDWETAYRELDDRVPHLLIQLQDDLARSRKREAAWISIIVHLLIFIALWNFKFIEKYIPFHSVIVVATKDASKDKNVTFLALPPDAQKLTTKPKTNVMSDKDRIATARHPELDPKELRKILATPPPGAPGPRGPRTPEPAAPQPPAMTQGQQMQQAPQGQQSLPQPPNTNQTAQLTIPARPNKNPFAVAGTAGSAIQEAARAAAARRGGGGGQEGDFGLGTGAHGRQLGPVEILSDTQGVDFGPYLQRLYIEVRDHWYQLIPESVEMKKGKLALEFAIMKDGHVEGLRITAPSGDVALDRPAYGAIKGSDPFPPLPSEFTGPYLSLRFRFLYNPDKADLE